MADVFVDLLYRGLPLGNRVRLARVEARSGYLEVPTPMPVGTRLSIASGDLVVGAKVIEVVEQTAGSDRPPGMLVRPHLEGEAQRSWWAKAAGSSADAELPVSAPSVPANAAPPVAEAPVAEAPVAVALSPRSRRHLSRRRLSLRSCRRLSPRSLRSLRRLLPRSPPEL
ncbi:MAG: hypothetical protein IPI49_28250 [Myxococcales bacterium]|nr:hypothetical protein [Myxococcales bacterium]